MKPIDFKRVPGPTPWYLKPGKFIETDLDTFSWKQENSSTLSGISRLLNSFGKTVLILDFYCYIRQLKENIILIWHEYKMDEKVSKENGKIDFVIVDLSLLEEFENYKIAAEELKKDKTGIRIKNKGILSHFTTPILSEGSHSLSCPKEFEELEEVLVLADYYVEGIKSDHFSQMLRAIYSFKFKSNQCEVYPQDWFNKGDFDFGYQWITQVARREDGKICGNGIRISEFLLDGSNRNKEK